MGKQKNSGCTTFTKNKASWPEDIDKMTKNW